MQSYLPTASAAPLAFRSVAFNQLAVSVRRAQLCYAVEMLVEAQWLEEDGIATLANALRTRVRQLQCAPTTLVNTSINP